MCPTCPTCFTCPTCPRTLRALCTKRPTCPTCPRAHLPKYIQQTGKLKTIGFNEIKLKISVLMKSNQGSFTDAFKGAEI